MFSILVQLWYMFVMPKYDRFQRVQQEEAEACKTSMLKYVAENDEFNLTGFINLINFYSPIWAVMVWLGVGDLC